MKIARRNIKPRLLGNTKENNQNRSGQNPRTNEKIRIQEKISQRRKLQAYNSKGEIISEA